MYGGQSMKDFFGTNFDAPGAHFNKLCLFSDAQAGECGHPKKCQTVKRWGKKQTWCYVNKIKLKVALERKKTPEYTREPKNANRKTILTHNSKSADALEKRKIVCTYPMN